MVHGRCERLCAYDASRTGIPEEKENDLGEQREGNGSLLGKVHALAGG